MFDRAIPHEDANCNCEACNPATPFASFEFVSAVAAEPAPEPASASRVLDNSTKFGRRPLSGLSEQPMPRSSYIAAKQHIAAKLVRAYVEVDECIYEARILADRVTNTHTSELCDSLEWAQNQIRSAALKLFSVDS